MLVGLILHRRRHWCRVPSMAACWCARCLRWCLHLSHQMPRLHRHRVLLMMPAVAPRLRPPLQRLDRPRAPAAGELPSNRCRFGRAFMPGQHNTIPSSPCRCRSWLAVPGLPPVPDCPRLLRWPGASTQLQSCLRRLRRPTAASALASDRSPQALQFQRTSYVKLCWPSCIRRRVWAGKRAPLASVVRRPTATQYRR